MSFFPLVHTATFQTKSSATDRSGQEIKSWAESATFNCLWAPVSGREVTGPRDEFETTGALYVDGNTTVSVGGRVMNIKDSEGNVVEAGPLFVQSVKSFFTFTGRLSHKTLKLVGGSSD